jgi:hypothetical protein
MLDFIGWYEISILAVIAGAYIHGQRTGMRQNLEAGVELTLETLEKQGVIKVCSDTGEIKGVAQPE